MAEIKFSELDSKGQKASILGFLMSMPPIWLGNDVPCGMKSFNPSLQIINEL